MSFGHPFHDLDYAAELHPFAQAIRDGVKQNAFAIILCRLPKALALLIAPVFKVFITRARRTRMVFSQDAARKRMAESTNRADFMSYILRYVLVMFNAGRLASRSRC